MGSGCECLSALMPCHAGTTIIIAGVCMVCILYYCIIVVGGWDTLLPYLGWDGMVMMLLGTDTMRGIVGWLGMVLRYCRQSPACAHCSRSRFPRSPRSFPLPPHLSNSPPLPVLYPTLNTVHTLTCNPSLCGIICATQRALRASM